MREIGKLFITYCSKNHTSCIEYVEKFKDVINSLQHSPTEEKEPEGAKRDKKEKT